MAAVLDSSASVASVSHHATAMAAAFTPSTRSLAVPQSRGLRIFFSSRSSAPGFTPYHRSHQRASHVIVCEQQQEVAAPAGVVTDKTWKELVLDSDIPVLVDFWAPWCGPCRMIAPIVDELAKLYAGRIRCLKLNTDESPNRATECGIRSIPTVLLFKQGEKKDMIVGAVPRATLITMIEKYLER